MFYLAPVGQHRSCRLLKERLSFMFKAWGPWGDINLQLQGQGLSLSVPLPHRRDKGSAPVQSRPLRSPKSISLA